MKNNSKTVYGGDLCVELTEVDKMLDESERIEQSSNTHTIPVSYTHLTLPTN